jgi:hypothetical protein
MKSRLPVVAVVAAGLVLAGTYRARALDLNPGEWEVASSGSADASGETPRDSYKVCLSPSDPVPMAREDRNVCKIGHTQVKESTVTWKVTCDDPGEGAKGEGSGTITYSGDTFQGTMETSMEIPGEPKMKVSMSLKGKRLGPCKP